MKIKSNTIMLGIITLLILGGVYWYFFTGSGNAPGLSSGTTVPEAAQFEALAGQLTPISFNTSIFSDPRFTSLIDLATPVTPEPSGRIDPFAPLAGVASK